MHELHTSIKLVIWPAKLPSFPSKNYLISLKGLDPQAIEKRKEAIEEYLRHILNDPAFLCDATLKFIEC